MPVQPDEVIGVPATPGEPCAEVNPPVPVDPDSDCITGPRSVIVSTPCGSRNCICDPCNHDGQPCHGGACEDSHDVNACEDFVLVFCFGRCLENIEDVTFIIRQKCEEGFEEFPAEVVNGAEDSSFVEAEIAAGTFAPGWYEVKTRVLFVGGFSSFLNSASFRVADCPTV